MSEDLAKPTLGPPVYRHENANPDEELDEIEDCNSPVADVFKWVFGYGAIAIMVSVFFVAQCTESANKYEASVRIEAIKAGLVEQIVSGSRVWAKPPEVKPEK